MREKKLMNNSKLFGKNKAYTIDILYAFEYNDFERGEGYDSSVECH